MLVNKSYFIILIFFLYFIIYYSGKIKYRGVVSNKSKLEKQNTVKSLGSRSPVRSTPYRKYRKYSPPPFSLWGNELKIKKKLTRNPSPPPSPLPPSQPPSPLSPASTPPCLHTCDKNTPSFSFNLHMSPSLP